MGGTNGIHLMDLVMNSVQEIKRVKKYPQEILVYETIASIYSRKTITISYSGA
ncbi:hypothetical protein [Tissierella praeacuta]|uniref:hypothetical protein n=1 Tax=Tissierella praeacuta TaxID=43131 RepID=UPI0033408AAB